MDEYKRLYSVGKAFGIESQVLSPNESKDLYPLLNVDDVYGTLYSPLDGTITPEVCTALARSAKRAGATIVEDCSVSALDVKDGKVEGVQTNLGRIKSQVVVNCAGAWGGKVAQMAGVEIPLVAMKHAYITTERIEVGIG